MTTSLNVRIDAESKAEAKAILTTLGVTMSGAVEMYFKQIIFHRGIPFDLRLPNKGTLEAIEELESGGGTRFSAAKEMFQDIGH